MKRVEEIKQARMKRHFDKRMDAHKTKKKQDLENELMKHVDLIEDPNVKQYILKKKELKQKAKEEKEIRSGIRKGIHAKMSKMEVDSDEDMLQADSSEEEEVQEKPKQIKQKALAKVKSSKKAAPSKKAIKK